MKLSRYKTDKYANIVDIISIRPLYDTPNIVMTLQLAFRYKTHYTLYIL